jgi:intracellular sulfur oxidation DsrE/DsrF family protein
MPLCGKPPEWLCGCRRSRRDIYEVELSVTDSSRSSLPRRSFLSRLGLGAAALGAGVGSTVAASAQTATPRFQPARHAPDDWFDDAKGSHRLVFDTTTATAAGGALLYANNFIVSNKAGYNLDPADLAIVIIYRHFSTPFAFNDAMWAKYGGHMSEPIGFTDPKTKQAPSSNLYRSPDYGLDLPNFGNTLDSLIQKGVRFAVCDMATRFFAGQLAQKTAGNADATYRELTANMIGNTHLVPSGIAAVNRAQERGYTFAYVA